MDAAFSTSGVNHEKKTRKKKRKKHTIDVTCCHFLEIMLLTLSTYFSPRFGGVIIEKIKRCSRGHDELFTRSPTTNLLGFRSEVDGVI
jgi:hypothetical protein